MTSTVLGANFCIPRSLEVKGKEIGAVGRAADKAHSVHAHHVSTIKTTDTGSHVRSRIQSRKEQEQKETGKTQRHNWKNARRKVHLRV